MITKIVWKGLLFAILQMFTFALNRSRNEYLQGVSNIPLVDYYYSLELGDKGLRIGPSKYPFACKKYFSTRGYLLGMIP
jgi:hypothetical protein